MFFKSFSSASFLFVSSKASPTSISQLSSIMRSCTTSLLSIAASAASVASAASITATPMPSVTLDYTTIVATAGSESIVYYKYQNIRYAAVPTGNLRFAKPQWPPVDSIVNNGTLAPADVDCATYEDCLYLDIWAPANSANKSLPVVVWTYGDRFIFGSKTAVNPEALFALSKLFHVHISCPLDTYLELEINTLR